MQSELFNEESKEAGEKTDEDDANSEIGQADIHNDEKWDTDIEQEGDLNFLMFNWNTSDLT